MASDAATGCLLDSKAVMRRDSAGTQPPSDGLGLLATSASQFGLRVGLQERDCAFDLVHADSLNALFSPVNGPFIARRSTSADHKHMVDPTAFSDRLDEVLRAYGISNAEFANGVDSVNGHQKVNGWRKRGRIGSPSFGDVRRVLPGVSMDYLNDGIGDMFGKAKPQAEPVATDPEWREVPVWSASAAAGAGSVNEDSVKIGSILFRPRSLEKKGIRTPHVFYVAGESMAPRFQPGDAILFDTGQREIRDGKVYVIRWGEELLVKRLYRELDGRIRVSSDNKANPEYQDRFVAPYETGFDVVGRVRWIGSWED